MNKIRDSRGRFTKCKNLFEIKDGLVYCYTEEGNLLFFTDDARVIEHSWGKQANGYSSTQINGKQIPVHRFISNPKDNELVDHINRNKKDNRSCNLRNTSKSVNAFNCDIRRNNTSGRTGVRLRKDTHRWTAEIKKDRKKITLGCFETYEQAVEAREEAEKKYYGNKQ
jgi:hypothetical protein